MITCTRALVFCAGHRLLNYDGPCSNLHGHNYVAEVTFKRVGGPLDNLGMVVDFREIKKLVGEWINKWWDHGVLLNEADPMQILLLEHRQKVFTFPEDPTAEVMAHHLLGIVNDILEDKDLRCTQTVIWETPTMSATCGA